MAFIEGYFPVLHLDLVKGVDGNVGYHKKVGSSTVFTSFNDVAGWGEAEQIMGLLSGRLKDMTNYSTATSFNWRHIGPWAIKTSGLPTPTLPDSLIESRVVKVSNAPFMKKVNCGQMVVSNFHRINALAKFINGGVITNLGNPTLFNRYYQVLGIAGFPKIGWTPFPSYGVANDAILAVGQKLPGGTVPIIRQYYQKRKISDTILPTDVGWTSVPIKLFIDKDVTDLVSPDDVSDVVTATLAEANQRTVDILTTLAEMPETVNMIKNAVLEVARLYRDTRKGHLRLINKAKRVQRNHATKIFRINYDSRISWLAARNEKSRRLVQLKRDADISAARRDLALFMKEFSDAVTSLWLTYRYGIKPNEYLVQDLIKANKALFDRFVRFSQQRVISIDPPHIPGFVTEDTIEGTLRCFIKRSFNVADIANKEYSWNGVVTLWEVLPLSFVADWMWNIGEYLSAISGGTNEYKQACTISVKIEDSYINYIHTQSGAKVTVHFQGYSRKVINPLHYCALRFDPFLDLRRILDSASLSYQIFVKSVLNDLIKRK